jgi:hypothetical protein
MLIPPSRRPTLEVQARALREASFGQMRFLGGGAIRVFSQARIDLRQLRTDRTRGGVESEFARVPFERIGSSSAEIEFTINSAHAVAGKRELLSAPLPQTPSVRLNRLQRRPHCRASDRGCRASNIFRRKPPGQREAR